MTIFTALLVLVLGACAGNGENQPKDTVDNNAQSETEMDTDTNDNVTNNNAVTEEDNKDGDVATDDDQAYMKEKMGELPFIEFQVEVDYPDHTEYEAEIKEKSTGLIKAELEDEINDQLIRGRQAFDEIYPIAEKLDINADSEQDEVIDQVLELFDLPKDYEEIEIKVILTDGKKIKFEVEK